MVLADGFAWNGQTYDSLSKVAFAITGTKWNAELLPKPLVHSPDQPVMSLVSVDQDHQLRRATSSRYDGRLEQESAPSTTDVAD
jgi:Protein of unknown function (DUF2924)